MGQGRDGRAQGDPWQALCKPKVFLFPAPCFFAFPEADFPGNPRKNPPPKKNRHSRNRAPVGRVAYIKKSQNIFFELEKKL